MRPLLIGQAPGPRTDPTLPLYPLPTTSAGGRLQQMMGIMRGQYLQTFDRLNLLYHFPGQTSSKEDRFPRREARVAADAIRPLLAGRTVVLVGRNVATAFGLQDLEFHQWEDILVRRPCRLSGCAGAARMAVVPHPSGRNHWYNTPENREVARAFWRSLLEVPSNSARKVLPFAADQGRV